MNKLSYRLKQIQDECKSLNLYPANESYPSIQIANAWYTFSQLMPSLLLKLAYNVSENNKKHSLVKIAYEELGEGIGSPHDILFFESCRSLEIRPRIINLNSIGWLKNCSDRLVNDSEILGLCFGLEFTAVENINLLFKSLLSKDSLEDHTLKSTPFFKVHFENEPEHIAENVNNLKLHIVTDDEFHFFKRGCLSGLMFWKQFWREVKEGEIL